MVVEHLVIDSSAFIHHGPIKETGKNIYSCPEVIDEIKDKATLESLRFLPYELKLLQFDQEGLDACIEFAKKTGDYRQLSAVDLRLIAATYCLEKKHNGLRFINKEPKHVDVKALENQKYVAKSIVQAMDALSGKLQSASIDNNRIPTDAELDMILDQEAGSSGEESEESDDEAGWITPQNIDRVHKKMGFDNPSTLTAEFQDKDRVTVACMTSDFSIQNCMLQMGLLIVSPKDGLMIREAKKIALRCHACFKVFYDPTKIKNNFCPHCGNLDTLKRVQYTIDKSGAKRVHINFKRPIKVKGTNKQLPRPRGGKHANNPILAPDQKIRKDFSKALPSKGNRHGKDVPIAHRWL